MGVDYEFAAALSKALIASDLVVAPQTPFLLSLSNHTKTEAIPLVKLLHRAGCPLFATEGTAALISGLDIPVTPVTKLLAGHPNVVDVIRNGTVGAVINTLEGDRNDPLRDGFHIRRAATEQRIPCFTSLDTANAAVTALSAPTEYQIQPLQQYRDHPPRRTGH